MGPGRCYGGPNDGRDWAGAPGRVAWVRYKQRDFHDLVTAPPDGMLNVETEVAGQYRAVPEWGIWIWEPADPPNAHIAAELRREAEYLPLGLDSAKSLMRRAAEEIERLRAEKPREERGWHIGDRVYTADGRCFVLRGHVDVEEVMK